MDQIFFFSLIITDFQRTVQGGLSEGFKITHLGYADGKWWCVMQLPPEEFRQIFFTSLIATEFESDIAVRMNEGFKILLVGYSGGKWWCVMDLIPAAPAPTFDQAA